MLSLSANFMLAISTRHTKNTYLAAGFALLTCALCGCGDSAKPPATGATAVSGPNAYAPLEHPGPTSAPATTPETGTSDQAAAPTNPNGAGAGDEEAPRTGIAIGLRGGGFTKRTPRKVHVPAFIKLELDIAVADDHNYKLAISGAGATKTHSFSKAGSYKLTLEGLRPHRSLRLALDGQLVTIVADAEPGP
jgi:hypothetical protein